MSKTVEILLSPSIYQDTFQEINRDEIDVVKQTIPRMHMPIDSDST